MAGEHAVPGEMNVGGFLQPGEEMVERDLILSATTESGLMRRMESISEVHSKNKNINDQKSQQK